MEERNEEQTPREEAASQENMLPAEIDHAPSSSQVLVKAYEASGTVAVTPEQAQILLAPTDPDDVEIHPVTGVLYVPWMRYVRRLNTAFGPMGWASVRVESAQIEEGVSKNNKPYIDVQIRVALVVNGRLVRDAVGECRQSQESRMSVASCLEGAMSSGIKRCCKSLGMFDDVLDKRWAEDWIAKYAIYDQAEKAWKRRSVPLAQPVARPVPSTPVAQPQDQEGFVRKVVGPSDAGVWTLVIETAEGEITVHTRSALEKYPDPHQLKDLLVEFRTKMVPQKGGKPFIGLDYVAVKGDQQ